MLSEKNQMLLIEFYKSKVSSKPVPEFIAMRKELEKLNVYHGTSLSNVLKKFKEMGLVEIKTWKQLKDETGLNKLVDRDAVRKSRKDARSLKVLMKRKYKEHVEKNKKISEENKLENEYKNAIIKANELMENVFYIHGNDPKEKNVLLTKKGISVAEKLCELQKLLD